MSVVRGGSYCSCFCVLQTYPSIRGRAIFRAKDRLALTKGILDSFFDMGVLQVGETIDRRVRFFAILLITCFSSPSWDRVARKRFGRRKLRLLVLLPPWVGLAHHAGRSRGRDASRVCVSPSAMDSVGER